MARRKKLRFGLVVVLTIVLTSAQMAYTEGFFKELIKQVAIEIIIEGLKIAYRTQPIDPQSLVVISPDEHLRNRVRATILNLLDENQPLSSKLKLYAEKVDYFNQDIVDQKFIYKDRMMYMKRWPQRSYWLKNLSEIELYKNRTFAAARYTIGFEVNRDKESRNGEAELAILIGNLDTQPKIY